MNAQTIMAVLNVHVPRGDIYGEVSCTCYQWSSDEGTSFADHIRALASKRVPTTNVADLVLAAQGSLVARQLAKGVM